MTELPPSEPQRPIRRQNPNHDLARRRIGQAVWRIRQRLGLTQEQLAARWQVSQASLSRWEAGTQTPRGADLIRIAQEAGIPTSVLVGDEEESVGGVGPLTVLHAIGGNAIGYTITLPNRFLKPASVGVEVLDGSASQVCPEGTVLLCEPLGGVAEAGEIAVVESAGALRLARAMPAEDAGGLAWMGLGETARWASPLGGLWRPAFRPYGAVGAFLPRLMAPGRPLR